MASRLASRAARVVTLKNTVPTSCTALADQSMREGSQVQKRRRRSPGVVALAERSAWGAFSVWRYCREAALVKKIDPTKNVMASASVPTQPTYPGRAPTAKQIEPDANSTPIHQPTAVGAHHVEPRPASRRPACFRCSRDVHSTTLPSGARKCSRVTNGPKPSASPRDQPAGART